MTGAEMLPIRVAKNRTDPACALPRLKDYLSTLKEVKEAYTSKEGLFSASSTM